MLKSKWFPSGEASLGQSIANISLNFPPSADGIIWRVRYLVTCARIVACPGVLLLNKYGWTFLKKHLGYATHPEHDSPSVTIGHLGNTNFNPQPKIQQSTSMQTHWQYATIAKHSSLEIVGYHVLAWFMPVSEGQCEGYSYLAAGHPSDMRESIGISFLGLQCCKNTLKPATRASLLMYPWCTQ